MRRTANNQAEHTGAHCSGFNPLKDISTHSLDLQKDSDNHNVVLDSKLQKLQSPRSQFHSLTLESLTNKSYFGTTANADSLAANSEFDSLAGYAAYGQSRNYGNYAETIR